MNLLVISHMYPSCINLVKGIFVREQVVAIEKKNVNTTVISPKSWVPFDLEVFPKKWEKLARIPFREKNDSNKVYYPKYLNFPGNYLFCTSGYRMYYGIRKVVNKLNSINSIDLIHAHVAIPDGYAAMLLANDFDIPYVVTIHGQDFYHTINENIILKNQIKKVIKNSGKTIVVSDKLKAQGKFYLKGDYPLTTIPNGINPESVITQKSKTISAEGRVILSVANLIERKGIQYVLLAIKKLLEKFDDIVYLVIGDGPYKRNLKKQAKNLGVDKYVKFLGQLPHDKVMEYMESCDVFALPSWNEGFGVVYIEAMTHGKPVIGCLNQGIEDYIIHDETGILVEPRDTKSLTKYLELLLENTEYAASIGKQGKKYVLNNLTWEKISEAIIDLYNEVLSAK